MTKLEIRKEFGKSTVFKKKILWKILLYSLCNIAISIRMCYLSLKYKIMFNALIILNNQLDFVFSFISNNKSRF